VLLTTLSVWTSVKGRSHLAGWLGNAAVVAFAGQSNKHGNLKWDVFLCEPEPRPGATGGRLGPARKEEGTVAAEPSPRRRWRAVSPAAPDMLSGLPAAGPEREAALRGLAERIVDGHGAAAARFLAALLDEAADSGSFLPPGSNAGGGLPGVFQRQNAILGDPEKALSSQGFSRGTP
jgi:hypothetical protein